MSKKKVTPRPVGRPRLNLPTPPRHFLQVERNERFDQALIKLRLKFALTEGISFEEMKQSEAVRKAVFYMVGMEYEE